ncbi:uncharacterized protein [Palaemon carinicauda]|uniref:uncharacterized protein n=1 Tax=Palaemon carinicauda TaxID=392227 RepID=UPI0035B60CE1
MEISWAGLLLVKLFFVSIWMTSYAQRDMSLLSQYLPRDTFVIGNTPVRSSSAFINEPPSQASYVPHTRAGLILRVSDSSQDPVFHRPVLPPQNHPLPMIPVRQQQIQNQIRSSTSRFGSGNPVPQLPVVPPSANVPQTQFTQIDGGFPSLTQQTIPQKSAVPDTSFVPSRHDHSSSDIHPANTGGNVQRLPQPSSAQAPTGSFMPSSAQAPAGSFIPSGLPQNIPVNHQQRPTGQISRRHPLCGVTPPTGDCRAAFPRYYYNPHTDQCDCFLYGGCGAGLQYSFSNLQACIETCLPGNTEEGPVCDEVFSDEEVFFDTPVSKPISANQIVPKPNADRLSDDAVLHILVSPVSVQENAARESNRLRQRSRFGGTLPG